MLKGAKNLEWGPGYSGVVALLSKLRQEFGGTIKGEAPLENIEIFCFTSKPWFFDLLSSKFIV